MKNKLLLLLTVACLLLTGCRTDTQSAGNDKTAPLDFIVQALQTADSSRYTSAFPPTFCEQYQTQTGQLQETLDLLLNAACTRNTELYGENCSVTYTLTEVSGYELSALEQYNQSVAPDFVYTLPLESITEASQIAVTVHFSGSYGEETVSLSYLVLCVNGNWYLHPKHFGTVFKNG